MKTWIGTSGFQYPEWKGKFYPEKMAPAKMLAFYAAEFRSTEVNYTFRSMPSAKTIDRWRDETPEEFRFSLKAPQRITHFAKLRSCTETVNDFHDAVRGLGGKLGPILFQLPATFTADAVLLRDFVQALPKGLRAAFEFRHESWFTDEVFDALRESNVALCIAESEDFVTPRIVTADFGYLRPRRLDYKNGDIREQAQFIREQDGKWSNAFVYYKHEETAAGPGFAKIINELLDGMDSD